MTTVRYDIISDTHGFLSKELLAQLEGADVIVHAGDICSASDYRTLSDITLLHRCLGNNDWAYDYGPRVKPLVRFSGQGLRWEVCHYKEKLDLATCEIAVCGHTHRAFVKRDERTGVLMMNPGSPTYPRGGTGPTMGRIVVTDGQVAEAQIIRIPETDEDDESEDDAAGDADADKPNKPRRHRFWF